MTPDTSKEVKLISSIRYFMHFYKSTFENKNKYKLVGCNNCEIFFYIMHINASNVTTIVLYN